LYSTGGKAALGPRDGEIIKEMRGTDKAKLTLTGRVREASYKRNGRTSHPAQSTQHRYDGPHDRRHVLRGPGSPAASSRD